jgi:hypothetical protein
VGEGVSRSPRRVRAARTMSLVVIAGLDPAIHAASPLAFRRSVHSRHSAWSPVVTNSA